MSEYKNQKPLTTKTIMFVGSCPNAPYRDPAHKMVLVAGARISNANMEVFVLQSQTLPNPGASLEPANTVPTLAVGALHHGSWVGRPTGQAGVHIFDVQKPFFRKVQKVPTKKKLTILVRYGRAGLRQSTPELGQGLV